MKNIFILFILLICQQSFCQLNTWEKLYGDTTNTTPMKIKFTAANQVIVIANEDLGNGVYSGIFSIFDAFTGNLIYQTKAQNNVQYMDVEMDNQGSQFLIVGQTTPVKIGPIWQDNESVFTTINYTGTNYIVDQINRPQLGREFTEEIMLHPTPHPASGGYDYYFTGRKNRPSAIDPPPTPVDQHIIGSTNIFADNSAGGWYNETLISGDDEYDRGIFPLANGNVVTVGNDGTGSGIMMELDGGSGAFINGLEFQDIIDLYCGYEIPVTDQILLGGTHFSTKEALLILMHRATNTVIATIKIPELDRIEELYRDANGYFYAVGKRTDAAFNKRNVVIRFYILYTHPTSYDLILDYAKYVDDNELEYSRAQIYLDVPSNMLYYTDGRKGHINSFGDYDMLVAAFDADMTSSPCIYNDTITFVPWSVNVAPINPIINLIPDPPQSSQGFSDSLTMNCAPFCVPLSCAIDFNWTIGNCYNVNFTALPSGPSPYTFQWDIYANNTTDYTIANPTHDFLQTGTYTVCLTLIDGSGTSCTICKQVVVPPDTSPPSIICPSNINVTVQACARGANVNLPIPIGEDCGDPNAVTISCNYSGTTFFPCGTTAVTCVVTDDEGMQDSCTYFVTVNCECAVFDSLFITCDTIADSYRFEAKLNNLTGSGSTCQTPIFSNSQLGVSLLIHNITHLGAGNYFVEGAFSTQVCPMVSVFTLDAQLDCICPDQNPIQCNTSTFFPAPCCDSVFIDPTLICATDDEAIITLGRWGTIKDISRIDWFVQNGPCPATPFGGTPFQSNIGYADLTIHPSLLLSNDICVYADVYLGKDELPCTFLQTQLTNISFCAPISASLQGGQSYCYMGSPVTPAPIMLNLNIPNCNYTIQWYDENNVLIPGNTNSLTYQPPALSIGGGSTICGKDFTYRASITGPCGPVNVTTVIRLDNEAADFGNLYLDPIQPNPVCYGKDATIRYDEACVAPNNQWTWSIYKTVTNPTWVPILGSGNMNNFYNTNRLYETTNFKVAKQNGVCPIQEKTIKINVKDPLVVSFNAVPLDICKNTGVTLSTIISPCFPSTTYPCQCDYTVEWYRNGVLLQTTNALSSPATFTYIDPLVNGNYSGYYYAVVKDNCCDAIAQTNTMYIEPPVEMAIAGPCFICDTLNPIVLTGIIQYPPTTGTASYQWYIVTASGDIPLAGETNNSLTTNQPGTYKLVAKWSSTCFVEAIIQVTNCTNNILSTNTLSAIEGDVVINGPDRGLILKSLGGFYYRIIANPSGVLTTYPCPDPWDMTLVKVMEADVITMQPERGLIQYDVNGLAHHIYIGNTGEISTTSGFIWQLKNTILSEANLLIDNDATGLVFHSANGELWRLMVNDLGELSTELIRDY